MERTYVVLNNQIFQKEQFKIVPIRDVDQFDIMKWRNEQIYHLRQYKALTALDQKNYFSDIVADLFQQDKPQQILFSYLDGDKCIGYGGLVHINWVDQNAEISFIMNTGLEQQYFSFHWSTYLKLIEEVAFQELNLHKIYTYAFDLRKNLYDVLEENNFSKEACLIGHAKFEDGFVDVLIHSKFNESY
jgi:RimJ/RimL family protein N-acetyltransferase